MQEQMHMMAQGDGVALESDSKDDLMSEDKAAELYDKDAAYFFGQHIGGKALG